MDGVDEGDPESPCVRSVLVALDLPALKVLAVELAGGAQVFVAAGRHLLVTGRGGWARVTVPWGDPADRGWECVAGTDGGRTGVASGGTHYSVWIPIPK